METWNQENKNKGDDDEGGSMVGTVLNKGATAGKQEEEKKFTAFTGQGVSLGGGGPQQTAQQNIPSELMAFADDPELLYAMKMSMMD